jgi:hypothetical protein
MFRYIETTTGNGTHVSVKWLVCFSIEIFSD